MPDTVPNAGTPAFTATAAGHEPARTGPAVLTDDPRPFPQCRTEGCENEGSDDYCAPCAERLDAALDADPTDDPEYRYKRLLYFLAAGPGFEDASQVPDYDPHRRWVLVQISQDTGHAWVSRHPDGPDAARSLAEDVNEGLVRLNEAESFLYSLDNGSRWTPSLRTVVVWQ